MVVVAGRETSSRVRTSACSDSARVDRTYAKRGIQRCDGALQDQGNLAAAQRAHLPLRQRHQVAALKQDAALSFSALHMKQPENGQRERAFSAAALAHKPEHFSPAHFEREIAQDSGTPGEAGRDV